jgi:hypothetical protein
VPGPANRRGGHPIEALQRQAGNHVVAAWLGPVQRDPAEVRPATDAGRRTFVEMMVRFFEGAAVSHATRAQVQEAGPGVPPPPPEATLCSASSTRPTTCRTRIRRLR